VGLRERGGIRFHVVVHCDAERDELFLLPLAPGESTLEVLADERRRAGLAAQIDAWPEVEPDGLRRLSLSDRIERGSIGSPLPAPRRVISVAVNVPSHLRQDLAVDDVDELRTRAADSRARLFCRYPYTPPPGREDLRSLETGLAAAFDPLRAPSHVLVPTSDGGHEWVGLLLDYEVEVGAVLGRSLTAAQVAQATDAELNAAIAGHVLVNDAKSRNVQVVGRLHATIEDLRPDEAYDLGDDNLGQALGSWGARTAAWWSYASSWGARTHLGPVFVEARADDGPRSWQVVAARSYAPAEQRGQPLPDEMTSGPLYLRQASVLSEDPGADDGFLWSVPDILRAALTPGSALGLERLDAGDVLALGTPGGSVITAKSQGTLEFGTTLLFWRSPRDWHDFLVDVGGPLFLHPGDELFLWAEGLGSQRARVEEFPVPEATAAP